MSVKIELFGHSNCPACKFLKDYFEKENILFDYVDIFDDPCYANDCGIRSVPTLIIGEQVLVNPNMTTLKNIVVGDSL